MFSIYFPTMSSTGSLRNTLNVLPFMSNILSNKYPNVPNVLSALYLFALHKLKTSFKVQVVTDDFFDDLLNNSNIKIEFLGDKRACCLLSVNSLFALKTRNLGWVYVSQFDEKEDEEESMVVMPPVPGCEAQDSNVNENSRLMQCLAISNAPSDLTLYITESTCYNLENNLGMTGGQVSVQKCTEGVGYPPIAVEASVAPIYSSFIMSDEDYDEILEKYFEKPKYVVENDVIRVVLKDVVPEFCLTGAYYSVEEVCFQVTSLTVKLDNKSKPAYLGCYIVKSHTSLYLIHNKNSYLPRRILKCVQNPSTLALYEIPACPDGLTKHLRFLKSLFVPFIQGCTIVSKPVFLLAGPRGCGKKTLVRCVARELGLHVLQIDCFDVFGVPASMVERKLEEIMERVKKVRPVVLLLQNIELIGKDRDECEDARIVHAFLNHIHELFDKPSTLPVLVVGVTSNPTSEMLPSVIRIFTQTITVLPPTADEASAMLTWILRDNQMECSTQVIKTIAAKATGYVFGDLFRLVRVAILFWRENRAMREIHENHLKKAFDIMEAAYSDSIGAPRIPAVHWEDVGGLAELKEEITMTLTMPLKHPELFASGLKRSGILLYGPPGTGKTLVAKAVATECNLNFLSVKGPELMNMYVGQSEKNVRDVFERARSASPCIIFFDELDSLAPNRGKSGDSGGVTDRVVSQLLAEMDGLQKKGVVFIIAATNRPDLVDPALLRPGRFDKMFYVGACDNQESKLAVLNALARKFTLADDVDMSGLFEFLPGQVTGADLYAVCSTAWMGAARRAIRASQTGTKPSLPLKVCIDDFKAAIKNLVPSLNADDMRYYEQLRSLQR